MLPPRRMTLTVRAMAPIDKRANTRENVLEALAEPRERVTAKPRVNTCIVFYILIFFSTANECFLE